MVRAIIGHWYRNMGLMRGAVKSVLAPGIVCPTAGALWGVKLKHLWQWDQHSVR